MEDIPQLLLRLPGDAWNGVAGSVTELGSRLHPAHLLAFVLIAFVLYLARDRRRTAQGFLGWLFPKSVYLTRSSLVDLQLFLLGRVLAGVRLLTAFAAPTSFAVMTLAALGTLTGQPFESSPASRLETALAGFLIVAVADFCVYWVHRLHHEYPIIWPFHAVHHSAEALTPLTVYRKHPVYDIISRTVRGALTGIAQGLILFAFIGELSALTIGGANAVYVIFNALGANLRHSHIWLDYGPFLGRVFISPAQHQIHHSRAPEHHNRNYGEVLAIWDWMFGTLYLPQRQEALNFGLSAPSGAPLEQPHGTFREAFIGPFVESARAFRAATRGADAVASTPEDPTA